MQLYRNFNLFLQNTWYQYNVWNLFTVSRLVALCLLQRQSINMATGTIKNKSVQCNLVLEKQIEHWGLKLLQKSSKLVQCKPSQQHAHVNKRSSLQSQ